VSLNIKDRETHELVKELAALRGTSMTGAVKDAVRDELERERAKQNGPGKKPKSRSEVLAEFSQLTAPLFRTSRSGNDLINDLYDEQTGLPR
jgi:antitoxin VapB